MNVSSLNEKIEHIPQTAIFALLGVVAFLALLPAWVHYDVISMDGAFQYVPMARLFLEQKFYDVLVNNPQLPLFPLIIAGVSKFTSLDLEMSGRIVSYMAYIVAALGIFKMTDFLYKNRFIALLAFLFLITNRQLINRSIDCLKESLFLCFIIWGNYLILEGISSATKKRGFYASGILILLAGAMLRSTSLVFVCAWLIVWIFRERKGILSRSSLLLIPVAGVLATWIVYPEFVLFKKSAFHLGYFFDSVNGTGGILTSTLEVLKDFFRTGNHAVILLGFYGLYYHDRDAHFFHVCLVLTMFFLILVSWIYASSRYFLAPIIWLYPMAGYGVVHAFQSGNRAWRVVGVLTVVSCIALWVHISLTPPDPDRMAWREAGEWILVQVGPDREIISNRDRLVFYARGRYSPLSDFREKVPLSRPLAIDSDHEGGRELIVKLRSLGLEPDKQFRLISVYLPRPGY